MAELSPEGENEQLRRQIEALEVIVDAAVEAHQAQADETEKWRERAEALRRVVERSQAAGTTRNSS